MHLALRISDLLFTYFYETLYGVHVPNDEKDNDDKVKQSKVLPRKGHEGPEGE